MNIKGLSVLVVVTMVVVIVAASLTQTEVTPLKKGKLFPQLAATIDQVTTVNVQTNTETITMIRDENWNWQMQEKYNYPVETDKVNNLLLAMTELTILEAKTSNSELYSKIGVDDVPDGQSVILTLKTNSDSLASLIIGNSQIAKIDSTRNEIYVRKVDDKQAWLVLGKLSVENKLTDWLERQIIDIKNDRVRKVTIGEDILIFKNTPDDEEFQLANLPANGTVKMPYMLKNIATTLSNLEFDDVIAADELELKPEITAIFTTFDGLEVTMQVAKQNDKNYATFTAKFNPEAVIAKESNSEEKDSKSEEKVDVHKQIESLNTKLVGWVYELSEYKVDDLAKKREELITIAEPKEELATPTTSVLEELGTPTTSISTNLPMPFAKHK